MEFVASGATTAPWTDDERSACLAVREKLIRDKGLPPSAVGEIELVVITLNAKCRVDDAVEKFVTYHEKLLGEYGISDVWAGRGAALAAQWHRLCVAGRDDGGRQIMWIHGGGTAVEEEALCIQSCCLYFFAVRADARGARASAARRRRPTTR